MDTDYHAMWQGLGLDLEKHDGLLAFLGQAYNDVYLSQSYRPEGMKYFDFVVSEAHGLRIKELIDAKAAGQFVVGSFCLYAPEELILALGGINVGLCGGVEWAPDTVASLVGTRNLCPLISSFMGFKLGRVCPYFEVADLLVGETTCSGKTKVWEILKEHQDLHVIPVPPGTGHERDYRFFKDAMRDFITRLEQLAGRQLAAEQLASAITVVNRKRRALARLYELRKRTPLPISGKDALLISQIAFYDDAERFTAKVEELCAKLEDGRGNVPHSDKVRRIMITGTPLSFPNWKLHHLIESSGQAVVVCEEACTGTRYFANPFAATGVRDDDLAAIYRHYLDIHCACFSPNQARIDDIIQLVREYQVDGVIVNNLSFCSDYALDNAQVMRALSEANIPALRLETDYSQADDGQLATRLQAFFEMLSAI